LVHVDGADVDGGFFHELGGGGGGDGLLTIF
jgi:hypothetical protein